MLQRIRTTLRREDGASAVEYGLLIAAVAAVIAGIVFLLGGRLKASFTTVCDSMSATATKC